MIARHFKQQGTFMPLVKKITSWINSKRSTETFDTKPHSLRLEIDPSKKLSKKEQEYLLFILNEDKHKEYGYTPYGIYIFKDNGQKVKVDLLHPLLKYHKQSNKEAVRWEVLDEAIGQGAYGTIIESLGVLTTPGNRITFKQRRANKTRVVKDIILDKKLPGIASVFVMEEQSNIEQSKSALHCKPAFFDNGHGYLIMTKADGIDLFTLMQAIKLGTITLSFLQRLEIIYACMQTVANLHHAKLIHRDIKPRNIMIDIETCKATLVDYDFACSINEKSSFLIKGTPIFIPPESVRLGQVSPLGDVFSLGITLKEFCGDDSMGQYQNTTFEEPLVFLQRLKKEEFFIDFTEKLTGPREAIEKLGGILHGMTRYKVKNRSTLNHAMHQINLLIEQEKLRLKNDTCDQEELPLKNEACDWDLNPGLLKRV